jgi:hypothetical protein
VLSYPPPRLLKNTPRRHSTDEASMRDRYTPRKRVQANLARSDTLNSTVVYATHIPTSEPPLFPATESKYLWALVVCVMSVKGCIFEGE